MGLGKKIRPDMESTPEDLQFARGTFPRKLIWGPKNSRDSDF